MSKISTKTLQMTPYVIAEMRLHPHASNKQIAATLNISRQMVSRVRANSAPLIEANLKLLADRFLARATEQLPPERLADELVAIAINPSEQGSVRLAALQQMSKVYGLDRVAEATWAGGGVSNPRPMFALGPGAMVTVHVSQTKQSEIEDESHKGHYVNSDVKQDKP